MTAALQRAAFLDRDGVINIDSAYLSRWEDFQFVPGSVEAMRRLQQAGYALVVVTNQSGIARGYYSEDAYQLLTRQMRASLKAQGVTLAGVYHCPHHPAGKVPELAVDCDCRKPAPGMILRAAQELQLDLPHSFLVGDKDSDLQAARAAGVDRTFLVGKSPQSVDDSPPTAHYPNLKACVDAILSTPSHSLPT